MSHKATAADIRTIHHWHQPYVVPLPDRRSNRTRYQVRADWRWEYGPLTVYARRGYTFDGASVPRIVWSLTGYTPDGLHRAASLAHDIACDLTGDIYAAADFPELDVKTPLLLLGDPCSADRPPPVAQLSDEQTHRMWHDFLRATAGHRPPATFVKGWGVRIFGPRWWQELDAPAIEKPPPKLP